MSWTKCTEAMPPAGSKVRLKWADGNTEWSGDPVSQLQTVRVKHYDTLLWWREPSSTDVSGLVDALKNILTLSDTEDLLESVEQGDQNQEFVNRYAEFVVSKKQAWKKAREIVAQYSTLTAPADEIEGSISEEEEVWSEAIEKYKEQTGASVFATNLFKGWMKKNYHITRKQ